MIRILLVIVTLLLSSCTNTQGLSVYSFTNADLEATLNQQLPKLRKNLSLMGLPVKFGVDELDVNIGPDNRDVVALSMDSSANISALVFNYPVKLSLQIEGSPYYNSKDKAVYLRKVNLISSSVDAGGYKGNLSLLDNQVMQFINRFLEDNPVYRLDTSNPKIRLLSALPLDMKVQQGAITIVPNLQ